MDGVAVEAAAAPAPEGGDKQSINGIINSGGNALNGNNWNNGWNGASSRLNLPPFTIDRCWAATTTPILCGSTHIRL